jgi:hypothetical protein
MRFTPITLFTLSMAVVFFLAVYTARGWPLGSRLFPWSVGIGMLVLTLVQLAVEIYRSAKSGSPGKHSGTGDLEVDWTLGTWLIIRRSSIFFGWFVGVILGIWLLGFFITIPLFAFLYLRIQAGEGWRVSLLLTLAAFLFLIGIFDQVLHVPWPNPLLPWPEALLKSVLPFVD